MFVFNQFGLWLFVLHCLPVATGQSQLLCSPQSIRAVAGDDVVLPCRLDPPISDSSRTVEWTRPGLDPAYIHVHQDGRLVFQGQNPLFKYRTTVFLDQLINGNVSLKIFNVKHSDAGKYRCFLPALWKESFIQLAVDDDVTVTSSSSCAAATTLSVVFGLMFVVTVVFSVWKWRQNKPKKQEELLSDSPPQEEVSKQCNTSTEHQPLMEAMNVMEDLDKKKVKLNEELKKKEEELKDLIQSLDALMEVKEELVRQKEQLITEAQEVERTTEETEKKVKSVDKDVTEKDGDKTVNRAQGYLKLKEIMTEISWKLQERKKDQQQLHMNIEKIHKRTIDEFNRITEKKNEVEKNMEQMKQQLQETETQREETQKKLLSKQTGRK